MPYTPKRAIDYKASAKVILAVGSAGAGKSTFLKTIPGRKYLFIFDSMAEEVYIGTPDLDYDTFFRELPSDLGATRAGARSSPSKEPWDKFKSVMQQTIEDPDFMSQYDVIAVDGLSTMADVFTDNLCAHRGLNFIEAFNSGNKGDSNPYEVIKINILNTINRLIISTREKSGQSAKTFYCTAHHHPTSYGTMGSAIWQILTIGNAATKLPTMFSDIFRFWVNRTPEGEHLYTITSKPDQLHFYPRTSMLTLPADVTWNLDPGKDLTHQGYASLMNKFNTQG